MRSRLYRRRMPSDATGARPHLILLRGNSASGKTTLASRLQRHMGRGTANIGQDHFRRVVLREHDVTGGDNIELIRRTARFCLSIDYHVILEGIFAEDHYGPMLRELVDGHAGPVHVFYLDASLEETLRRHEGRAMRAEVPPEALRRWWRPADVLGVPGEIVVDTSGEQDAVLAQLVEVIGPVRQLRHEPADTEQRYRLPKRE